ncbi:actin-associated protein FAM107A [Antennarius striatus]|uniref:actin-associated protein FAM107A n=1 Tax=Antennarius striatus TaxID=241820 RepID=UPI0035B3885F
MYDGSFTVERRNPTLISLSDHRMKAETSSGQSNPVKPSKTHNELHKELLLAHKRGLVLSSRSELQQVLERRKRVQTERQEGVQGRTPLENALLRRQQRQVEREKGQQNEQEEAQFMEFVRVRQNLRKIHSALQNKVTNA